KKDNSILIWEFFFFFLLHWTVSPFLLQPFPLSFSHEKLNFLLPLIPLPNQNPPMAKTLISSSPFVGSSLPSLSRHVPLRRHLTTRVNFSFHELPPIHSFHSSFDFPAIFSRAEGLLYTLADAAVAVDSTVSGGATSTSPDITVQKNGGWFGFISEAMEVVLKVLKGGLEAVHVPYSYGFAIILLTIIVKVATLPLTKQQVESTLAMQNLQPKIKAIQQRYAGNQERIQLETSRLYRQAGVNPLAGCLPTLATIPVWIGLYQALSNVANEGLLTEGFFWIPSLGGPTTIAARQSGAGISWLLPFVDGHPPLGWSDTAAYLVLPVLLVVSQYVSMEIMKPPQTDDPAQKNTLLIFKFLPLMIGYFSLFTNNVLSTAQQVWLRKLGGAKPVVNENAPGIITAGRAKRTPESERTGDREDEKKNKLSKAARSEDIQTLASESDTEDGYDGETTEKSKRKGKKGIIPRSAIGEASGEEEFTRGSHVDVGIKGECFGIRKGEDSLEEAYASSDKDIPAYNRQKRSKRSKRKRAGAEGTAGGKSVILVKCSVWERDLVYCFVEKCIWISMPNKQMDALVIWLMEADDSPLDLALMAFYKLSSQLPAFNHHNNEHTVSVEDQTVDV
uniref:Membrane insertase YidC/Oxa/ALB C-terminal domain-containing protein n=1 Tax=Cucumis melo TaxID=3656 RepID=A0A9I9DLE7_CUCME